LAGEISSGLIILSWQVDGPGILGKDGLKFSLSISALSRSFSVACVWNLVWNKSSSILYWTETTWIWWISSVAFSDLIKLASVKRFLLNGQILVSQNLATDCNKSCYFNVCVLEKLSHIESWERTSIIAYLYINFFAVGCKSTMNVFIKKTLTKNYKKNFFFIEAGAYDLSAKESWLTWLNLMPSQLHQYFAYDYFGHLKLIV